MLTEIQEAFLSIWLCPLVMACCLSVGVGFAAGGMVFWNRAILWQVAAWPFLFVIKDPQLLALLTLPSVVLIALSARSMVMTIDHYLKEKTSRVALYFPFAAAVLPALMLFTDVLQRLAAAHLVFGLQALWIATRLLPRTAVLSGRRWRWLGSLAFATAGTFLLIPAVLVLTDRPFSMTLAFQGWNVLTIIGTVAILLAHRDEAEQELKRLATRDILTGLLNRHAIFEAAHQKLREIKRQWSPLTLMLLDLDHFKQINDQHGHPMGDNVLRLIGEVLHDRLRPGDFVGRYGGEEFLLLIAGDAHAASLVDKRLREGLVSKNPGYPFKIDFSAGAVSLPPGPPVELDELVKRADTALYRAKAEGRGRLVMATEDPPGGPAFTALRPV